MKPIQSVLTILVVTAFLATANPTKDTRDSPEAEIFVATTPCGGAIRPLHKISQQTDCAMVEWKLTLYHDPVTLKPAGYKLKGLNRFIVKETNMYSQPGTMSESEGKWTIIKGTKTRPDAIIYQLNPVKPQVSIRFLKLSDNLLHLLDKDGNLMIGNAFWSYTINRIKN